MDLAPKMEDGEVERAADESDRASQMEAVFTDTVFDAARQRGKPESHSAFDGISCVERRPAVSAARLVRSRECCVDRQRTLVALGCLYRPEAQG